MQRKENKKIPSTFPQDGFTLIELMVSLTLFVIVVLALIGSLYTVNDASHRVQAMRNVMDNLNFAIESMSRTIRTGTDITCGTTPHTNCSIAATQGNAEISLNSTLGENKHVEYRWVKINGKGVIQVEKSDLDGSNSTGWEAITAPEVDIQNFNFYVDGALPGDGKQPSVIIRIQGVASVPDGTLLPFAVQTYLSQRTPEAQP
ncbi:MAG TPA: prepilin-type N-terminal cleavage/methylation domain-containing protein [Candidatus Paceibacterota bacterium]|nr:prepilin-type N-terminal cleavage/methylation domain-containing protein [Candidatus Paceibacterota bacterium]